jgi:hypothetical protein
VFDSEDNSKVQNNKKNQSFPILSDILPPLVRIHASVNTSGVVMVPSMPEVYKNLDKIISFLIEQSRIFPRWMRGTCLVCSTSLNVNGSGGGDDDESSDGEK